MKLLEVFQGSRGCDPKDKPAKLNIWERDQWIYISLSILNGNTSYGKNLNLNLSLCEKLILFVRLNSVGNEYI